MKNLSGSTEYQCKARLVGKDDEKASTWDKHTNITTLDSEVLMGQSAVQNIAEEADNRSNPTAVPKKGDGTSSLGICLSVYSVVFALVIIIVYNCRGGPTKPTRPIVSRA